MSFCWLLLAVCIRLLAALGGVSRSPSLGARHGAGREGGRGLHGDAEQGAAADRLVGASSPAAARVELHVHITSEGGVMKMREVPGYDVPAGAARSSSSPAART